VTEDKRAEEFAGWAEHYGVSTRPVSEMSLSDAIVELVGLERKWATRSLYDSPDNLRRNRLVDFRMTAVKARIDQIGATR